MTFFLSPWRALTRPSSLAERTGELGARPDCACRHGRVRPGHVGGRWLPVAVLTTLVAVLLVSLATHAFAVEPSERLANPQLEARAEAIGRTLRCLVCQNESIEESNASLAHDIRVLLRQLLLKGDT
ncbi:MAG TPA: cytochrome c-type biogenesis protein, partial [Acetobacteraceae bacterium]|nr:cytochrome c-type biogenesis protein [Acetobacteraceae bacterium]